MKLAAITKAARTYWVSLVVAGVLAGGLVALVISQRSGGDWRKAQIQSAQKFARHLRLIEATAYAANARVLAQQSGLDHQATVVAPASAANGGAGTAAPGHGAGAASRDPGEVAREFAMFYANLAANEDHPASPAQVQELAGQLAASCSTPRYGQYPCVVHLPARVRSIQHCVAVVGSSGAVTGRCSVGSAPAPVVTSGYVDCASVGRVVSVADASGDEQRAAPLLSSVRLEPGSDPHADLIEVRVAATPTKFCADFRTSAPLIHGSWFGINLYVNGSPDLQFAPTINFRDSPTPELQSPVNTPVAGQIGTAGDLTSLTIAAGDPAAPLPDQPFQFRAYANHEVMASGAVQLTTDSAPNAPRYASYP